MEFLPRTPALKTDTFSKRPVIENARMDLLNTLLLIFLGLLSRDGFSKSAGRAEGIVCLRARVRE